MRIIKGLGFAISLACIFSAIGCGSDNSMSKAEMDASKHAAPMTDAQKAAIKNAMEKGGEDARASEAAWAKANPDKVAAINAERAKAGKPPLGH